MRRIVALAALVALTGATASAQVAGMHRGLFIGTSNEGQPVSAVGEQRPDNSIIMYKTGSNANPGWGNRWFACDAPQNQGVITYQLTGPTTGFSVDYIVFDTILPGPTQTISSLPSTAPFPQNITDVSLNSDGDVVGVDSALQQIVKLDLLNATWTGSTLSATPLPLNIGLGGVTSDRLSGDIYFANSRAITTLVPATNAQGLYRIGYNFQGLTTVALTTNTMISANFGGDLLEDGTWVSSDFTGLFRSHSVAAGSSVWTQGPSSTAISVDVTRERYSAPGIGYYAMLVTATTTGFTHQAAYLDASTTPHTVTTLTAPLQLPNGVTGFAMELFSLYNNDLCTVRTGKATWDINVRPDPVNSVYANRNFVVVASLTTPNRANPIALPSGRELFLAPDPLTNLTVKALAAPFIQNNIGTLDPFGNATAKIDLSLLRSNRQAVNGTVVHLAGIVLNPAAPEGVDWVLEPWAFTVNILP